MQLQLVEIYYLTLFPFLDSMRKLLAISEYRMALLDVNFKEIF